MHQEVSELKALPQSAVRLSALLSHADWVLGEIVHTVEHDPALTGRLLELANSARMAGSVGIDSVADAFLRVGPGPVLSLALGSAVRLELQRPLESYGLGERELWRHSVASALAVDRARRHCTASPPTGAFVAALLHDVGKLVLDRLLRGSKTSSEPEQELQLLGTNHCVVGGMVASHWRLSPAITEAIVHHHDPSGVESDAGRRTACFAALADSVAHRLDDPDRPAPPPFVSESVGLDGAGFERLCGDTLGALESTLAVYG